jgi:hypothetical protein
MNHISGGSVSSLQSLKQSQYSGCFLEHAVSCSLIVGFEKSGKGFTRPRLDYLNAEIPSKVFSIYSPQTFKYLHLLNPQVGIFAGQSFNSSFQLPPFTKFSFSIFSSLSMHFSSMVGSVTLLLAARTFASPVSVPEPAELIGKYS